MKSQSKLALLIVVLIGIISMSCASRNLLIAPSTLSAPQASVTVQPTAILILTTTAPALTAAPPAAASTPTPPGSPTAAEAAVMDDEEECRKACHVIDLNALFGVGAKRQPANHKGYTTCLECHAGLTTPALPATHLGRQDPACPLCHLIK